jgi:hypothetical protein
MVRRRNVTTKNRAESAAGRGAGDPLVVRLPDVMGKIADDPKLIGRNAVRLAAAVEKYRASEPPKSNPAAGR